MANAGVTSPRDSFADGAHSLGTRDPFSDGSHAMGTRDRSATVATPLERATSLQTAPDPRTFLRAQPSVTEVLQASTVDRE
ncbi:hypothetical protein [Cupriavidus sp. a3]|uniref:hypothetical protein n=1 Tax=Cupriavidus sp. a3 TaxID=3242158 RepID=UPI003D9C0B1B